MKVELIGEDTTRTITMTLTNDMLDNDNFYDSCVSSVWVQQTDEHKA